MRSKEGAKKLIRTPGCKVNFSDFDAPSVANFAFLRLQHFLKKLVAGLCSLCSGFRKLNVTACRTVCPDNFPKSIVFTVSRFGNFT